MALQLVLDPINKKAQRVHTRLKHKTCERRKMHLERRSAIIQGIRVFCVKFVSLVLVLVIFYFFLTWAIAKLFIDLAVLV